MRTASLFALSVHISTILFELVSGVGVFNVPKTTEK